MRMVDKNGGHNRPFYTPSMGSKPRNYQENKRLKWLTRFNIGCHLFWHPEFHAEADRWAPENSFSENVQAGVRDLDPNMENGILKIIRINIERLVFENS